MTAPSNTELREAIEELRVRHVEHLFKSIKLDFDDGFNFNSAILALFQAREQQAMHPSTSRGYLMGFKAGQQELLTELLGEVTALKTTKATFIPFGKGKIRKFDASKDRPTTEIEAQMLYQIQGYKQGVLDAVSVIQRLQNKTNDGGRDE